VWARFEAKTQRKRAAVIDPVPAGWAATASLADQSKNIEAALREQARSIRVGYGECG
jgi:hypothetical protein